MFLPSAQVSLVVIEFEFGEINFFSVKDRITGRMSVSIFSHRTRDVSVELVWQSIDEIGSSEFRCLLYHVYVIGVRGISKPNVFPKLKYTSIRRRSVTENLLKAYRQWEHRVFLEENGDSLSDVVELQGTDIQPIDQYLALCNIVDPGDQVQDGALSRAILSNDYLSKYR